MRAIALTCGFCLVLVLGMVSPQAQADIRVSKDAFLKYNAETVDALLEQIETEPAVQKRFTKHFGKDADELIAYFKSNLVAKPMPATQKMIVYGCNAKGVIYARHLTIRKGYPMFFLEDGTPILKARCGNPVGTELPAVIAAEAPKVPVEEEPAVQVVEEPEPKEQMIEVPAVMPDVEAPVAPTFESVAVGFPEVAPGLSDQTLVIPQVPGGGGTPFLFLLPVIGFAGGGGDGYVIPEPNSLAQFGIMGLGLVGVGWRWTAARRRRK